MSTTPPGWYDDGRGALRWWDGAQWTEHVQPPVSASVAPAAAESTTAVYPASMRQTHQTTWADAAPAQTAGYGAYPAYPPVTPAKRSNLWILWLVLGVVALAAVVTAIVVIPRLLAGVMSPSGGAGSGGDSPTPDETAAIATVRMYDQAWREADCDLFFAATTEQFRTDIELADCDAFAESARSFNESTSDYIVDITDVWTDQDAITVTTAETYTTTYDDEGNPLDAPESAEDDWTYTLIDSSSSWVIDEAGTD